MISVFSSESSSGWLKGFFTTEFTENTELKKSIREQHAGCRRLAFALFQLFSLSAFPLPLSAFRLPLFAFPPCLCDLRVLERVFERVVEKIFLSGIPVASGFTPRLPGHGIRSAHEQTYNQQPLREHESPERQKNAKRNNPDSEKPLKLVERHPGVLYDFSHRK